MYLVKIRPVKIGERIYQVGEKVKGSGKEINRLLEDGYLEPIEEQKSQVKESKDGKKTD